MHIDILEGARDDVFAWYVRVKHQNTTDVCLHQGLI